MKTLFFIILIIVGIAVLYHVLTFRFINPYTTTLIFGKKGSGKSTLEAKFAVEHIKKGYTVYCTDEIPDTYKISVNDIGFKQLEDYNYKPFDELIKDKNWFQVALLKLKNYFFPHREKILLLIDEVGLVWNNRDYAKFKSEVRQFFKFSRKYHCKVIMFSQSFDVDKQIRSLTDQMYLAKNYARVWSYCKKIKKIFDLKHGSTLDASGSIPETLQFAPFFPFPFLTKNRILTFIPHWIKYFKSYNAPELEKVTYTKREFINT